MPMVEEYVTLSCVSNEVGGPSSAPPSGSACRCATLLDRAGVAARRRPDRRPFGRRLHRRLPDRRRARRSHRARGRRHERRAAAGQARLPGAAGDRRPVRLRVGDEVGDRARGRPRSPPTTRTGCRVVGPQQAPIKTESRIDVPRGRRRVAAGPVTVAGVAWAPTRGIDAVEVQVDDGPWQRGRARDRDQQGDLAAVALPLGRRAGGPRAARARHRRRPARAQTADEPRRRPTARPATTPSSSTSRAGDPADPRPVREGRIGEWLTRGGYEDPAVAKRGAHRRTTGADRGDGPQLNIFLTLARYPGSCASGCRSAASSSRAASSPHATASSSSCAPRSAAVRATSGRSTSRSRVSPGSRPKRSAGSRSGPDDAGWSGEDSTLLRAVDELHDDHCIADATWNTLASRYGTEQLIEIPMLAGHYAMLAGMLNSLGVQPETTDLPGLGEA